MTSWRISGSTSADESPDVGPRILLMSCTSLWKASRVLPELPVGSASSMATAEGIFAVCEKLAKLAIGKNSLFVIRYSFS